MIRIEPQINADERRFIVHFPEQSVEFLPGAKLINSPQRAQSTGIHKIFLREHKLYEVEHGLDGFSLKRSYPKNQSIVHF